MYELAEYDVSTIWGKKAKMFYRKDTNDRMVIDAIMVYDEYKAKEFLYRDGDIFIELGSHISAFGILMAVLNPTFKVYSVEAVRENCVVAVKNILVNNLPDQVTVFNKAVSGVDREVQKICLSDNITHHFIGSSLVEWSGELEVETLSLNTLFEENNITHCRVLKSDAEGGEVKAFSTLKEEHLKNIDYVIGEFHPSHGVDRKKFFGFFEKYFMDETEKYFGKQEGFGNFLFMNRGVK